MLKNVMQQLNGELSASDIKQFKKNNILNKNVTCSICNIEVNIPGLVNVNILKRINKEEYMKIYSNVPSFTMSEDVYLKNCNSVIKNALLLLDLPLAIKKTNEDLLILQKQNSKIYDYLIKKQY